MKFEVTDLKGNTVIVNANAFFSPSDWAILRRGERIKDNHGYLYRLIGEGT